MVRGARVLNRLQVIQRVERDFSVEIVNKNDAGSASRADLLLQSPSAQSCRRGSSNTECAFSEKAIREGCRLRRKLHTCRFLSRNTASIASAYRKYGWPRRE